MPEWDLPGVLRRIRRTADLSQREIARTCGIAPTVVAKAEAGARDLPVRLLVELADVAGLRLALVDADGGEVSAMTVAAVRDRAGRRFPAHLDTRHGDEDWWHGVERHSRLRPTYTFDRGRALRDWRRGVDVPADHHVPEPGDSLSERAAARREAAWRRRDERRHQRWLAGPRAMADERVCSCSPGCEYAEGVNEDLTHTAECACRCDVS